VTDDEAFIRAIVDSPGDDTPRLVYADWLDEGGDPRGAYLRAEIEWAKPWRDGTPPGWSHRVPGRTVPEWDQEHWNGLDGMLKLTGRLDPVWVARVSRPPVGVCCDHLRFRDSGPALAPGDIAAAEAEIGHKFPRTVVAFLLNYNGGEPNRSQLVLRVGNQEEGWCWDWVGLDWFARLPKQGHRDTRTSGTLASMRAELAYCEEELGGFGESDITAHYVPVGQYYSTSVLLMKWEGDSPEAVFGLNVEDGEAAVPKQLVPSLPQLLARIVTTPI
jgi:uncharacterized protein (TIGR02996 family)